MKLSYQAPLRVFSFCEFLCFVCISHPSLPNSSWWSADHITPFIFPREVSFLPRLESTSCLVVETLAIIIIIYKIYIAPYNFFDPLSFSFFEEMWYLAIAVTLDFQMYRIHHVWGAEVSGEYTKPRNVSVLMILLSALSQQCLFYFSWEDNPRLHHN